MILSSASIFSVYAFYLFLQIDMVDLSGHYYRPLVIRRYPWHIRRSLYNPYHPEDGDLTENLSRAQSPEMEEDIHYRGELSSEKVQKKITGAKLRVNGKIFKVVTNKSEFFYSDENGQAAPAARRRVKFY